MTTDAWNEDTQDHDLAIETHAGHFESISAEIVGLFHTAHDALDAVDDLETRDILRRSLDCDKREFEVARDTVQREIDRLALMGTLRGTEPTRDDGRDTLLQNSALTDQIIGQARLSKEGLDEQGENLKAMQNRLKAIEDRMPGLRGVLTKITMRENRDNLIVGVVIALLVMVLIVYKLGW